MEGPDDIWADDRLGRREDADYIERFLAARIEERGAAGQKRSYVLNLDAGWGRGKTFFLNHLAADLRAQGHIVAYVNAWRDDFSEDPFVPVMASIDEAIKPHLPKRGALATAYKAVRQNFGAIVIAGAKGAAMQVGRKVIGAGVDELGELLAGNPTQEAAADALKAAGGEMVAELTDSVAKAALANFASAQASTTTFKTRLQDVTNGLAVKQGLPLLLYVLVDELDRCRPLFAIAMLERIKHLFEADNVVFIVATDSEQLQHSIRVVYGAEFDAAGYLGRFFDRTYRFSSPSTHDFVADLLARLQMPWGKFQPFPNDDDWAVYLSDAFGEFGASLREIEQCYDLIRTVATVWDKEVKIEIGALLPLALAAVRRLPVTLDSGLLELLRNRRETRLKTKGITLFDPNGRRKAGIEAGAVFRAFASMATTPLPDTGKTNYSDALDAYIQDRFGDEYQRAYGGGWRMNTPKPMSVLTLYPEMLSRAGQLSDIN